MRSAQPGPVEPGADEGCGRGRQRRWAADGDEDLRLLGVDLAVDDFGTGYSSLSYLQQFPVQALKIDRSFVGRLDDGRMDDDGGSRTITRAVVNLASGLRLRTVAEGIENAGHLAAASGLGCDLGQGWFLGRPARAADAVVALREGVLLPQERDAGPS